MFSKLLCLFGLFTIGDGEPLDGIRVDATEVNAELREVKVGPNLLENGLNDDINRAREITNKLKARLAELNAQESINIRKMKEVKKQLSPKHSMVSAVSHLQTVVRKQHSHIASLRGMIQKLERENSDLKAKIKKKDDELDQHKSVHFSSVAEMEVRRTGQSSG